MSQNIVEIGKQKIQFPELGFETRDDGGQKLFRTVSEMFKFLSDNMACRIFEQNFKPFEPAFFTHNFGLKREALRVLIQTDTGIQPETFVNANFKISQVNEKSIQIVTSSLNTKCTIYIFPVVSWINNQDIDNISAGYISYNKASTDITSDFVQGALTEVAKNSLDRATQLSARVQTLQTRTDGQITAVNQRADQISGVVNAHAGILNTLNQRADTSDGRLTELEKKTFDGRSAWVLMLGKEWNENRTMQSRELPDGNYTIESVIDFRFGGGATAPSGMQLEATITGDLSNAARNTSAVVGGNIPPGGSGASLRLNTTCTVGGGKIKIGSVEYSGSSVYLKGKMFVTGGEWQGKSSLLIKRA